MAVHRKPQLVERAVADLVPYARNSRTHSHEQVAQIAAAVREFGWTNPLLIDGQGTIIAGHGRLQAARKLGLDTVPCIVLDHLTEGQRRALVIADNKLATNAGWDADMLECEFRELQDSDFDMNLLGFSQDEMAGILADKNFEPAKQEDQTRLDEKKPTVCPNCDHEFRV
jgi:ParB-like chromosome segregation protein Spo0J